jgi:hypothetical protein
MVASGYGGSDLGSLALSVVAMRAMAAASLYTLQLNGFAKPMRASAILASVEVLLFQILKFIEVELNL